MNWTNLSSALPPDSENAVIVLMEDKSMIAVSKFPEGWGKTLDDWKDAKAVAWQPIQWPEVPREETQEERDSAAYVAAYGPHPGYPYDVHSAQRENHWCRELSVWRKALAWERQQVVAELNRNFDQHGSHNCIFPLATLNRLRRRCGFDK